MADSYRVEVTNAAQFDAAMAAAVAGLADLGQPLEEAGRRTLEAASPPRRSGRMAGSARVTGAGKDRARMTVDTAYAAPIHWGWPGHGIRRQPWVVASWMRNPAPLESVARTIQSRLDTAAGRSHV